MPENYIVRYPSFGKCLFCCSAKDGEDTELNYKGMGRNPQYMRRPVCRSKQVIKGTVKLLRKKSEDISNVRYCFNCSGEVKKGVLKALRKRNQTTTKEVQGSLRVGDRLYLEHAKLNVCFHRWLPAKEEEKAIRFHEVGNVPTKE